MKPFAFHPGFAGKVSLNSRSKRYIMEADVGLARCTGFGAPSSRVTVRQLRAMFPDPNPIRLNPSGSDLIRVNPTNKYESKQEIEQRKAPTKGFRKGATPVAGTSSDSGRFR